MTRVVWLVIDVVGVSVSLSVGLCLQIPWLLVSSVWALLAGYQIGKLT